MKFFEHDFINNKEYTFDEIIGFIFNSGRAEIIVDIDQAGNKRIGLFVGETSVEITEAQAIELDSKYDIPWTDETVIEELNPLFNFLDENGFEYDRDGIDIFTESFKAIKKFDHFEEALDIDLVNKTVSSTLNFDTLFDQDFVSSEIKNFKKINSKIDKILKSLE